METTEKIVEAYVRYVNGWLTIPNIKCKDQMEIDLLAVDLKHKNGIWRYHIESGVSISQGFSLLTNKPFSPEELKKRVGMAGQRRTLGYFTKRKFGHSGVRKKLKEFGFVRGNYTKVIVSWGWKPEVEAAARRAKVVLWDFKEMLRAIAEQYQSDRTYFIDDTMRTLQLMAKAMKG